MGYKCAILGHKFGDAEVERDRQEDGNEVIITVREVETCARCGESRTVSENKEVTTLETAADIIADDLDESGVDAAEQDTDQSPSPEPAPAGTATETETAVPDAEPSTASDVVDAAEDDAVILDEDEDEEETEDEREPGEWPEESTGDEEETGDVSWPEADDEDDEQEWEMSTDIDPQPGETAVRGIESDTLTVPEGTFVCPECEFATPVESSSLREGDFCPECHMATLDHRTD
ncbi:hypothetical protein SAMN05216226_102312 [Halovenus aranensis]|jgi:hypothetical protein|uniref:Uncharacterized protein n=1 Tax=Halovenus aranensis TaxID=890420 RepID=A0A1G8T6C1_9EURY|nr:hypothetical protein [Halovenus aranensis]SDJ36230.1 hypothetical protein SAMN05216226_102312 [Halovenus aranensis]